MNGNQSPDLGEIAFNDMVDLKKRLDTIEKRVSRVIGILERMTSILDTMSKTSQTMTDLAEENFRLTGWK
jgi:hypothetical protein